MPRFDVEIMTMLKRIFHLIRTAFMLAMVVILTFSAPMSAHSSMSDHDQHMDHMTFHAAMAHGSDDTHHMDQSKHDEHSGEHAEMGCCFGICAMAMLVSDRGNNCAEQSDVHEALPVLMLGSVDTERLIRPPNH